MHGVLHFFGKTYLYIVRLHFAVDEDKKVCYNENAGGMYKMNEKLHAYKEKFEKELFENVIPFWLKYGVDETYGGMYTALDREGKIYSTDKSVWMQGRAAYMFAYLYNRLKKDERFLEVSKSCLDFLEKYCIDKDGRMFFLVTKDGLPLRKRRYWFSESFYIIACAEYYKATGEEKYLRAAKYVYGMILDIYRDSRRDPYKITPKSYASTRATKSLACPMILLNVTHIMREADGQNAVAYDSIARDLIAEIQRDFYKPDLHIMLETVGLNGEIFDESAPCRVVNPGHDIECAWFLLDEGAYFADERILTLAKSIFDDAIVNGWDEEYGGIKYFVDYKGLPVEAYEHDMKLWWPHNEGVIASLKLYQTFGDEKYLQWFERLTEYAFAHFSDPIYGEWFGYLRRDGVPTQPPCKGHTYKGPFHVLRMLAKCIELL